MARFISNVRCFPQSVAVVGSRREAPRAGENPVVVCGTNPTPDFTGQCFSLTVSLGNCNLEKYQQPKHSSSKTMKQKEATRI